MDKIYFEGMVVDRDITILTKDLGVWGKNKSLTVVNHMRYESLGYHQLNTYTLDSISQRYIREVRGYGGLQNQEFMTEFTKVLGEAIKEFNKDVEYENSLDFIVGIIIIRPIERFFDWLKK